jgi:hypothetical protein
MISICTGPSLQSVLRIEQTRRRGDAEFPSRQVYLRHYGRNERDHDLGTRTFPASGDDQQILAEMQHVSDLADMVAGQRPDGQPDQLMVAELIRVRKILKFCRIDQEGDPAQLVCLGPVLEALELDEQPAGVPPGAGDSQRPGGRGVRGEYGARGQPQFWVVSAHIDYQFTADAVRSGDPADY